MTTIRVRIGPYDNTFGLYVTRAPRDYDTYGTLCLEVDGDRRVVLVSLDYSDDQLGRYASGGYRTAECEDLTEAEVQEALVSRLYAALPAGGAK